MTSIDIIALAGLGGILPAIFWLWFWLREDEHPEPWQYLTLVFILGMVMVPIVIPFELAVQKYLHITPFLTFFLHASLEESFKYIAAYSAALRNKVNNEPVDPIIYLIVAALGFAALENTLYLTRPLSEDLIVDSFLIANLRFVGATLLHVVASAIVGVFLAFSFYKPIKTKIIYLILGLLSASLLHTLFNWTIDVPIDESFIIAFLYAWIGAIVLLIIFNKIRKIKPSMGKLKKQKVAEIPTKIIK